ncbi:TRAP transporter large permease subunit [Sinorhizobium meliloti]|uniref:TRAP transporter large permease n=1 Tax=Rhizobium meliloti TaxID=382 RepID=UPI00299E70B8|nr:TRAP transporter large permease subunit [Sinorhizobium meliloti]MDX0018749.1 TRAP transporter large permease subunit [Sinorhizobium meliloti]
MIFLAISFLVLLLLGAPIVVVIGASALIYFLATGQSQFLVVLPQRFFAGMDMFVLLAIPLFLFAGNVMVLGGLAHRLIDLANLIVGRFRGGASLTTIWTSLLFGGVSGSAAADAAALGSIMVPEMKRQGYSGTFAAALVATSSIMVPLMPPSIAMIIYGALTGTSIGRLFIAGIPAAVLLGGALSVYALVAARLYGHPKRAPLDRSAVLSTLIRAIPVALLPIIIVGGIRGGIFTPTEGAAVASVYALIISVLVNGGLSWPALREVLLRTALMTSTIYLLVGMASVMTFIFSIENVPSQIVDALTSFSDNRMIQLLLINLILFFLGMFLDSTAIMILAVPSLVAVGEAISLDPVHLGVIVVFNLMIGFVTPPVGLSLFILASVTRIPLHKIALAAVPMVGVALAVLMVITFVPSVVLFLPELMMN